MFVFENDFLIVFAPFWAPFWRRLGVPRTPQDAPRPLQNRSKDGPNIELEVRSPQERPKTPQELPRDVPGRPKRSPGRSQGSPKRPKSRKSCRFLYLFVEIIFGDLQICLFSCRNLLFLVENVPGVQAPCVPFLGIIASETPQRSPSPICPPTPRFWHLFDVLLVQQKLPQVGGIGRQASTIRNDHLQSYRHQTSGSCRCQPGGDFGLFGDGFGWLCKGV